MSGHCQVNVVTATLGVVSAPKTSGRCHGVPRHERARAQKSLMAGAPTTPASCIRGRWAGPTALDRAGPLAHSAEHTRRHAGQLSGHCARAAG